MPGHGGPHGGGPHGGFGGGPHGGHGHRPPPPHHHRGFGMGHRPYRRGCMGCLPGCLMPVLAVVGIIVLALVLIF